MYVGHRECIGNYGDRKRTNFHRRVFNPNPIGCYPKRLCYIVKISKCTYFYHSRISNNVIKNVF